MRRNKNELHSRINPSHSENSPFWALALKNKKGIKRNRFTTLSWNSKHFLSGQFVDLKIEFELLKMNHNVLVWLSKRKFQKYTRNVRFRVWVLKSGKSSIIFGLKTVIFKTAFCFQFSIQNVRFGSVLAKLYNQVPSLSQSRWRTLLSCRKLG